MKSVLISMFIVVIIATVLRFYQISEVPSILHADEASQGYNAFSLLKTGRDMHGNKFPLLFMANGSYQLPLYTYLTIIPTMIFGPSVFSVRLIAALSGILLVLSTFLIVSEFAGPDKKSNIVIGLFSSLIIAVSPWSVFFSRFAVEAGLSLTLFVVGIYLFLISLRMKNVFWIGCVLFGFTTYAYYSERIISILFVLIFVFIFRKYYKKRKMEIVFGIILFICIIIPNLVLVTSNAFSKRFMQVSFLGIVFSNGFSLSTIYDLISNYLFHYFTYLFPKNLFFIADAPLGRVTSNLGVLYSWCIIPFLFGIGRLFKERSKPLIITVFLLLIIAPIPAGATGDIFNMWRVLVYLWAISIVVAYGIYEIWKFINNKIVGLIVISGIISYSVFMLYISYFVIAKYENQNNSLYSYQSLLNSLTKRNDKEIIIDATDRLWGAGVILTYLSKYNPVETQKYLSPQIKGGYYNNDLSGNEVYKIGNIEVRPIDWTKTCGDGLLIVGDKYSVSDEQIIRNQLKSEFVIYNLKGDPNLFAYSTVRKCSN